VEARWQRAELNHKFNRRLANGTLSTLSSPTRGKSETSCGKDAPIMTTKEAFDRQGIDAAEGCSEEGEERDRRGREETLLQDKLHDGIAQRQATAASC
jgi:hypothetical protein